MKRSKIQHRSHILTKERIADIKKASKETSHGKLADQIGVSISTVRYHRGYSYYQKKEIHKKPTKPVRRSKFGINIKSSVGFTKKFIGQNFEVKPRYVELLFDDTKNQIFFNFLDKKSDTAHKIYYNNGATGMISADSFFKNNELKKDTWIGTYLPKEEKVRGLGFPLKSTRLFAVGKDQKVM